MRINGAYAVVALITGYGILAFRDPLGIRPLSIGIRKGKNRNEYVVSSETALFSSTGFKFLRDVEPGEAVFIDNAGKIFTQQCSTSSQKRPCIFEYVYLARPDSTIDEISVYKSRMRMGLKLAERIRSLNLVDEIDVVIPIPDSSTTAALQLAADLNKPCLLYTSDAADE